jgi:2-dehydropantoate 2-reductase
VEHAAELPDQDLVFVTLKSFFYSSAAEDIGGLISGGGRVVFVGNGVPWWWNHGLPRRQGTLPLLDPNGLLWNTVTPERVLGCVVYSINEVVAPGVIRHSGNNRWLLGEPDNSLTPRLGSTVELCRDAGVMAEASLDLRAEIWTKLLRNAPLNSICALTRLPIDAIDDAPDLSALFNALIDEIVATAAVHGWDIRCHVAAAREAPRRGGALSGGPARDVRPSMLQDVLAGRQMEVESILGQPQAFAREAAVPTPAMDAILPLLRGLNRGLSASRRASV